MKIIRNVCILLAGILILISCEEASETTELPIMGMKELGADGDTIYHAIPTFALLDQDSTLITEQVVKDKIYVADFFFTSCPTICPKMSQQMLRLHDSLLMEDRVILLSHTIDPAYDSVAVLKTYAEALGVETHKWHMLTGDKEAIYNLGDEYMVPVAEDPDAPGGYLHSGAFILLDKSRRVRGYYDGTIPQEVDELLQDIQFLLKE